MRGGGRGPLHRHQPFGTLPFNVVYGPALTDVLSRYTGLTGRPALPPPFAFGPWISSDIWRDGGEVSYAVTKFRERGIPVSGFVFDSPWEIAYNDFKFNIQRGFSRGRPGKDPVRPPRHVRGDRVHGVRQPHRHDDLPPQERAEGHLLDDSVRQRQLERRGRAGPEPGRGQAGRQEGSFFVRASKGGPPLVVPWWKGRESRSTSPARSPRLASDRLNDLLTASMVDTKTGKETAIGGFKTDDGESGNGTNTYIPETAVYSNGQTGKEFVNGYCLEYHKTVYSVLAGKGLIFARSGFTGTRPSPAAGPATTSRTSAQNGLPSVIVAGLSAAMSGYSIWGHDVGGYLNTNFSTLARRPVHEVDAVRLLLPDHADAPAGRTDAQPQAVPLGLPRGRGDDGHNRALANYKFYATLHTRLYPYIYTYAKQSSETGLPIIRPLVLIHPDDPKTFPIRTHIISAASCSSPR